MAKVFLRVFFIQFLPEQNLKFGGAAGRLFVLKRDGRLVCPLAAPLGFRQHVLVDLRALVGRGDGLHAAEGSRLPLAAARVHRGVVNCGTLQHGSAHPQRSSLCVKLTAVP